LQIQLLEDRSSIHEKGILKYYFKEVLALENGFSDSENVEILSGNFLIQNVK